MEDVAKNTVVDFIVHGVGLLELEDETIVEPQRAAQVVAERCGREASRLHERLYDEIVFGHGMALLSQRQLLCVEILPRNGVGALHHELQHEATHFARRGVARRLVVGERDVAGSLQQPVKVVGINGHFVVDGGEVESLAHGVGNERGVVDAFGHVAFVAREH